MSFPKANPALSAYVPDAVLRHLASAADAPGPRVDRYPAALALVDITGFTTLTTALARRGPAGTEQLSHALNGYLERIIDVVGRHGGDTLKIVGDGLLVSWPAINNGLVDVTRRAAACGLEIASGLSDFEVEGGIRLSLKVGVSAGDMVAAHVGGLDGRWLFVVAGDGPSQFRALEPHLQTGGVVLSPQAWALIETSGVSQPIDQKHVRILLMKDKAEPRGLARADATSADERLLRAYVPAVALSRLDAGQEEWLGEFRPTTVLFANVRRTDSAPMRTDDLQELTLTLQRVIARFQGWSKEITIDEKGTTFVAAFGVPPYTHEDDAVRALAAARDFHTELKDRGLSAGIGIATGAAFCGPVGSAIRRDFAVIGEHANLAARLAQLAPHDGVLCDGATHEAAQHRVALERLPAYVVKGMTPVAVYRSRGTPGASASTLVDRHDELEALGARVDELRGGIGGLILLEGEAGVGKSRVVEEAMTRAAGVGVRCLVGAGVEIESSTPYYAWRPMIEAILGIASGTEIAARRDHVIRGLRTLGSEGLATLLDQIVATDFADNELTVQMSGGARAETTRELLVRLVARQADASPLMIVIDDVQWMDSVSWALAFRVLREIPEVLLVLTARPPVEDNDAEQRAASQVTEHNAAAQIAAKMIAVAREQGTAIPVSVLPRDDALRLASERMGAVALAEPLAALVHDRAEGNPLFVEQLTYAMRDGGHIVIEDGTARFASDAAAVPSAIVPGSVQRVITSRIDQLPAAEALTLKVASVIGRAFTLSTLRDVHPLRANEATLRDELETLMRMDLVRVDTSDSEPSYRFTHAITQQVAYQLMLPGQSRLLHRSIAERFERAYASDLASHHAFLAHHWREAGVADRALEHLERAAALALRGFANDEAVSSLEQVMSVAGEGALTIPATRRGLWEIQLGEAYANLSKYKEGGKHLAAGLQLMGRPAPQRGRQEIVWLLREILEQALRRAGLWWTRSRSRDVERTAAVLRAYWALAEVSFYSEENDVGLALWCTIRMLNSAEGARNHPEMARAFGSTGALFGVIPVHRFAEWYLARASAILGRVDDLTTHEIVEILVGFYYVGIGKWALARERIARADAIARRLGDRRRLADALSNLIEIECLVGNFASAASVADEVYDSAIRRADQRWQAEALAAKAYTLTQLGRAGDALKCLSELKALDASATTPDQKLKLFGALALAHLSRGERQQAIAASDEAAGLAKGQRPAFVGTFYGYAAPAEVRLALWETKGSARPNQKDVDAVLKPLQTYASVFPVGRPRALNLRGRGYWLMDQRKQAFEFWQRALAAAEALDMPYEQALAHYELGRHLDAADDRASHLTRARAIFERLGASDALGRTNVAAAGAS